MTTRAWCVVSGALVALVWTATAGTAQSLERRVAAVREGTVRLSFAARPGVYGNGRNVISWDCDRGGGRCRSRQVEGNYSDLDGDDWTSACDSGPVRVVLTKRGGAITDLRTYVGGEWRSVTGATDLGTVGAREAAAYLLAVAEKDSGRAAEKAILPAVLADSAIIWPDLLRIARNDRISRKVRRSSVFWLGQAAGEAATRGLTELVDDRAADRDVRESAVFALSQRPKDEGVPALLRIARQNPDPELRKKAIFWLGQSEDPRALALFEELLTKP
jgi:hypothetical protein